MTEQQVHEIAVSNTPGLLQSQIYPLSSLIGLVLEDLKMEKELLMHLVLSINTIKMVIQLHYMLNGQLGNIPFIIMQMVEIRTVFQPIRQRHLIRQ